MKKTNNKGFSLVELIIVIAIMAILAGAIAPALIKYIDKSRRSNDVSSCKTIKTAIETALGNESLYEYLTTGGDYAYVYIQPGKSLAVAAEENATTTIKIVGAAADDADINGKKGSDLKKVAQNQIGSTIGEKSPKLKFKKDPSGKKGGNNVPKQFVGVISKAGTVYVYIDCSAEGTDMTVETDASTGEAKVKTGVGYQISPNIADEYQ